MKRPAFYLLLSMLLGILAAYYSEFFSIFAALSIILLVFISIKYKKEKVTIFLCLLFLVFSFLFTYTKLTATSKFALYNNKEVTLTGKVVSLPSKGENSLKIKINDVKINNIEINEKLLVNIKYSEEYTIDSEYDINIGKTYKFKGTFSKPNSNNNPGGFDYASYLLTDNIRYVFKVNSYEDISFYQDTHLIFFADYIFAFRKNLETILYENLKPDLASFVSGLVFGDRNIEANLKETFTNIGLSHMLVVSGLHVSLIYAWISFFLKFFKLKERHKNIIISVFIILYVILTGFEISAIRGGVFIIYAIITRELTKERDTFNVLLVCAILFLIINPLTLFDLSFQLSFVSVLGLITLYPVINNKIKEKVKIKALAYIADSFAISFCAQVLLIPIMINNFGIVSPISFIANLIILPIADLLIIIAVIGMLFFFTPLCAIIFKIISILLGYIILLAEYMQYIPYSYFYAYCISLPIVILYYVFIFFCFGYFPFSRKKWFIPSVSVMAFTLIYFFVSSYIFTSLEVYFLDVGQGDCAVIMTEDMETYLIDTGGNALYDHQVVKSVLIPFFRYKGIKKINGIFISHSDVDHCGELSYLTARIRVNKVYVGNMDYYDKDILTDITRAPLRRVKNKEIFNLGNKTRIEVLLPNDSNIFNDNNNNSLVCILKKNGYSILFTGDIGDKATQKLLKEKRNLNCDIIKMPHHGSYYNGIDKLLDKSSPDYAIISVGKNNTYSLPNEKSIRLLKKKNIQYYRTDTNGAIKVTFKSNGLKIEPCMN